MQDGRKAVWSIPYISVEFFQSLKQNFIAYRSSEVSSRPDSIFEIHQLWQSGFSRVYSNCCCSCSFEAEIIKIGQSSHNMYSNNILNFHKSTTILNACLKKSGTYWGHHVLAIIQLNTYLNKELFVEVIIVQKSLLFTACEFFTPVLTDGFSIEFWVIASLLRPPAF